jgi:hypothetical protein
MRKADGGRRQQSSEWRDVVGMVKKQHSQDLFTDVCEGEERVRHDYQVSSLNV